jgi:hypothetical protein
MPILHNKYINNYSIIISKKIFCLKIHLVNKFNPNELLLLLSKFYKLVLDII